MENDLTTQEAADRLQVADRTIRNWIDEGAIIAYKLNPDSKSVYRIPLSEINRILRERAAQMPARSARVRAS